MQVRTKSCNQILFEWKEKAQNQAKDANQRVKNQTKNNTHDTIVLSDIAFVSLKPFHLRKLLSTLFSPSPTGTSTMFSLVEPSDIPLYNLHAPVGQSRALETSVGIKIQAQQKGQKP